MPKRRVGVLTNHKVINPLPPSLFCRQCFKALDYRYSISGGVQPPEHWDFFVCPSGCGAFEYRRRTRTFRRL